MNIGLFFCCPSISVSLPFLLIDSRIYAALSVTLSVTPDPPGLAFSADIGNISRDLVHLTHWEIAALFRSCSIVPFRRGVPFAAQTLPGVFSKLGCTVKKTGKARGRL